MPSRLRSLAPAAVAVVLTSALAVSSTGLLSASRKGGAGPRGADQVDAGRIRADLSFIASDELEGRDTPSRGLDLAARYLASRLQALGLKPGGDDGGYFQRIGTTRRTVDPAKATLTLGDRTFSYGDDFLATAPGTAEGAMVYVGHGYVVKKKNVDAYAGADVKGKIVVAHAGFPEGVTRADLRGESGPDTWESPASYARPPRRPRRRARARLRHPGRLAHQPRQRGHGARGVDGRRVPGRSPGAGAGDHRVGAARVRDLQRRIDQRQRRRQVVAGAQAARGGRARREEAPASRPRRPRRGREDAERRRRLRRQRSHAQAGIRRARRPLRPHRRVVGGDRSHQQRRRRRRVGHRRAAEHGRGAGPRQREDAAIVAVRVARRRGEGPVGLALLRRASDRAARARSSCSSTST